MAFPVDLLDSYSLEELENSAEDYLSDLRCGDPENPEFFSLLDVTIPISLSTVGFVPLYGGDQTQKILALFSPEDSLTAVALYLADQWWAIEDIVKTSVPSREGLQQVRTLGERVVLYVLNRIIYRKREMQRNEIPFLCHSSTDYAKILWKEGEAIGFYSVKPTGSICVSLLTQNYQLPVIDTMFVRKKYRDEDFGLHMLEDFVDSFTEDILGLRYPLTSIMYEACKQYCEKYPGDHELLWEVEGAGQWYQRIPVTRALQRETLRIIAISSKRAKRTTPGGYGLAAAPEFDSGSEDSPSSEMQLTIDSLDDFASTSEGHDKTSVSIRIRSSNLYRPKIGSRCQDSEFSSSQEEDEKTPQTSPTASVIKLESTPRISENSQELPEEEHAQNVIEFDDGNGEKDAHSAPETQSHLEKQDGEKEFELEPMNGEVIDDTIKTSPITEEDDSLGKVLDEEFKLQSFNSNEYSTNLVPPVLESSQLLEAVAQDKTSYGTDSGEELLNEGPSDGEGLTEEKLSQVPRKKSQVGSSDNVTTVPTEERKESPSDGEGHTEKKLSQVPRKKSQVGSSDNVATVPTEEQSLNESPSDGEGHTEKKLPQVPRKKSQVGSSNYVATVPTEKRSLNESPSDGEEHTEKKLPQVPRKKSQVGSSDNVTTVPTEELNESPSDGEGHTEKKLSQVPRKKSQVGSSDNVATVPTEKRSLNESPSDGEGHTEKKLSQVPRKKSQVGSSDNVATVPTEERSDSAFPNSVVAEFSEEPISENLSPNTTSKLEDQVEEGVSEPQEASPGLPQSSLMEVELEDMPFAQNAGQKNQSEDQSEASSEHLDQFTQSIEKTVDSSSEEIEVEVPVVDRRNLRRKAKGYKGPAKKKAKLT